MERNSIILNSVRIISEGMECLDDKRQESITDRQERVKGFDQKKLESTTINLIGCGGLGSEIGEGLLRKGVRNLYLYDGDKVEISNLTRQRFYKKDLHKNKAISLAENLSKEAVKKTVIRAIPAMFQEAVEDKINGEGIAICGVDNNPTRVFVSQYHYKKKLPVIFTAVSRDANHGYVFVQEPGKACFGCLFPQSVNDNTYPCPGTPAIKDILKVVSGMVLYAVDTLIMKRPRNWSYKEVFLDGFPDRVWQVERKEDCKLCKGL